MTFLCYSGQREVNYGGSHSIRLDVVLLVVQSEVDKLFFRSLHQDIASVHVAMLKLQCLEREINC